MAVEADEEEIRIASGRSHFAVRTHPAGDFPRLPVPTGDIVTLPVAGLTDALRQVTRAASNEDSRPILTGVLMAAEEGGLRLVATDSYRLAVRDLRGVGVLAEGQRVLVPSRALNELMRLLGSPEPAVTLRLGPHDATFTVGSVALTTRLIEGEFPNYRQLIPSAYPNRLIVGREPLLDAVRRVKLLARDATTPVRIALRPNGIELTVITTDWGTATEDVDAKYEGAEMTVAFNPTTYRRGGGDHRRRGDPGHPRRPQTGHPAAHRGRRVPLPADAGPGVVSVAAVRACRPVSLRGRLCTSIISG